MGKCILAGHPPMGGQIGYGTYTGDGAASRFINLGVMPKWVLVVQDNGGMYLYWSAGSEADGGLAVQNSPVYHGGFVVNISGNGFYVYHSESGGYNIKSNLSGCTYNYIYGT